MNLTLRRTSYTDQGIFGTLFRNDGSILAYTLEHAYQAADGLTFEPKLAPGVYTCVRHAPNRLPYETFEVTAVPDFQGNPVTGLLIHVGNYNHDSIGCILLGIGVIGDEYAAMLSGSKVAFEKFMNEQHSVNSFVLTVKA